MPQSAEKDKKGWGGGGGGQKPNPRSAEFTDNLEELELKEYPSSFCNSVSLPYP